MSIPLARWEVQRLLDSGFQAKVERLYKQADELPHIASSALRSGLVTFSWGMVTRSATYMQDVVEYLGLEGAAAGEAWLRRQLEGLGGKDAT